MRTWYRLTCPQCARTFPTTKGDQVYCTPRCRGRATIAQAQARSVVTHRRARLAEAARIEQQLARVAAQRRGVWAR